MKNKKMKGVSVRKKLDQAGSRLKM